MNYDICPICGQGSPNAATRQGQALYYGIEMHLIELACRCRACGHEWGFDPTINWMEVPA